ncbi:hypothetical protein Daus18300_006953 [Diaporthe australafricana]|uniref:Uncharacterized protein n=1 Tax=Diaporthe australafricana TaxID=127596 RepID=A0ABR3WRF1_9PEZI
MGNDTYTSVPLDDDGPEGYALGAADKRRRSSRLETAKRVALMSVLAAVIFVMGFGAGDRYGNSATSAAAVGEHEAAVTTSGESAGNNLPAQAFVPDFPMKGVKFDFPTDYEDTSVEGDKLWDKLMPRELLLSFHK